MYKKNGAKSSCQKATYEQLHKSLRVGNWLGVGIIVGSKKVLMTVEPRISAGSRREYKENLF